MNRREALRTLAAGGAAGLVTAGAVAAAAPAVTVHDPFLEAMRIYLAERDAVYAIASDKVFDEAYDRRLTPLLHRMDGLVPTTAAGALLAVEWLKEGLAEGPSSIDGSMLDGLTAFLEGRAS